MDVYNEILNLYFRKVDKDLGITKHKFGLTLLLTRNDMSGGTDLASNLTNEMVIGVLEDILKTIKARKT